jgi:hypothetical protein
MTSGTVTKTTLPMRRKADAKETEADSPDFT